MSTGLARADRIRAETIEQCDDAVRDLISIDDTAEYQQGILDASTTIRALNGAKT